MPLGEVAKVSLAQGPSSIRTENAQLTTYIYVDLRDRDLGSYVADAQKAVAAERAIPARFLRDLERPVRVSGACQGAAQDRRPGDAAHHLPAALSQFPAHHRDFDRDAVGAVRAGRRLLADVVARLQSLGGGRCGFHRARRRRGRDGRRHADLSRSRADRAQDAPGGRRKSIHARRPLRRHHVRCRRTGSPRR